MTSSFARSHGIARPGPFAVVPRTGSWSSAHAARPLALPAVLGNAAFLRASAARRLQLAGRARGNHPAR